MLGMQQIEVNPPAAAAAVPVAIDFLYSRPGTRRCTCRSMRPGGDHSPRGLFHHGRLVELLLSGRSPQLAHRES